jgi:L-arabinose isomerase
MAGIELVLINDETNIKAFKNDLKLADMVWKKR